MRYRELLLEYNHEATLKNFGEKLVDRFFDDPRANKIRNQAANYIMLQHGKWHYLPLDDNTQQNNLRATFYLNYIEGFDPTRKKAFTQWLVKTYLSGGIRYAEDFGRANEALTEFITIAQSGYFRRNQQAAPLSDINHWTKLSDLETWLSSILSDENDELGASRAGAAREYEASLEATILVNNSELKVVIPQSKEASCYFGKNTRWCTAATKNNYFNSYHDDGPLYIVLDKKNNRRWQLHFETDSFMDEQDQPIESFDDFPMQAFDYIDFADRTDEQLYKIIANDNAYESDGAGLPESVLEKVLDVASTEVLTMSLLKGEKKRWESELTKQIAKRLIKRVPRGRSLGTIDDTDVVEYSFPAFVAHACFVEANLLHNFCKSRVMENVFNDNTFDYFHTIIDGITTVYGFPDHAYAVVFSQHGMKELIILTQSGEVGSRGRSYSLPLTINLTSKQYKVIHARSSRPNAYIATGDDRHTNDTNYSSAETKIIEIVMKLLQKRESVVSEAMRREPNMSDFLNSSLRNQWVVEHGIKVYVRRARRLINRETKNTLDLASLTSNSPGSGKLGLVFDDAEKLAAKHKLDGIYVESVLNDRLRPWLEQRGYTKLPGYSDLATDLSPCYWKSL